MELSKREQNRLTGGGNCCICGCQGSSSTGTNGSSNYSGGASGKYSPEGGVGHGSDSSDGQTHF